MCVEYFTVPKCSGSETFVGAEQMYALMTTSYPANYALKADLCFVLLATAPSSKKRVFM